MDHSLQLEVSGREPLRRWLPRAVVPRRVHQGRVRRSADRQSEVHRTRRRAGQRARHDLRRAERRRRGGHAGDSGVRSGDTPADREAPGAEVERNQAHRRNHVPESLLCAWRLAHLSRVASQGAGQDRGMVVVIHRQGRTAARQGGDSPGGHAGFRCCRHFRAGRHGQLGTVHSHLPGGGLAAVRAEHADGAGPRALSRAPQRASQRFPPE